MDVFIALLVLSAIAGIFVMLVRRSNKQAQTLDTPQAYRKLELLTRAQRKALHLPQPTVSVPVANPTYKPTPTLATTLAIRDGWSIGVVAFNYEDSVGNITDRIVTVHSVSSVYLKGECHDKHAERTFRFERMVGDLTDCGTGEVLPPIKWARQKLA